MPPVLFNIYRNELIEEDFRGMKEVVVLWLEDQGKRQLNEQMAKQKNY